MPSSITTNIAAFFAQRNLSAAGDASQSSIARLSSGQRIVRASDDVAALSIGTILRTNVNTLRTALSNANQASTVLQIADGGLANITEILQRQKALATQATSGSLSDAERGFLNQEFQALATEIDRLVDNTKFNSVVLLNGSLSKAVDFAFNTNFTDQTNNNSTTNVEAASAAVILTLNAVGTDGDVLSFNGFEITLTDETQGTTSAVGKVQIGASATGTVENIVAFLNSSNDGRIANFNYRANGATIEVLWGAGYGTPGSVVDVSAGVVSVTTPANYTAASSTIATDEINIAGLSEDRVFALGTVTGTVLISGSNAANETGAALDLTNALGATNADAGIQDNAAFIGKLGEGALGLFQVTYTGTADEIIVSLEVGDVTYTSAATVVDGANDDIELIGARTSDGTAFGGSFTLSLRDFTAALTDGTAINNQTEANELADAINEGLAGLTFVQNRDVTSFNAPSQVITVDGIEVANLAGTTVDYRSSNFTDVKVESVSITAPNATTSDAVIEITINGEVFRSYEGLGGTIDDNTVIGLRSLSDSTKTLTITTGNDLIAGSTTTAIDLSSQENADAVAAALEDAFGVTEGSGKLSFQTGAAVTDKISIEIQSAASSKLYLGQDLDILTVTNAQNAGSVIDAAINKITSLRADVGALQSRFNYAAANLQTAVQNQEAARSAFLDADISEESTRFASNQVLLQASISVLAQANLLPQNLLKLIG